MVSVFPKLWRKLFNNTLMATLMIASLLFNTNSLCQILKQDYKNKSDRAVSVSNITWATNVLNESISNKTASQIVTTLGETSNERNHLSKILLQSEFDVIPKNQPLLLLSKNAGLAADLELKEKKISGEHITTDSQDNSFVNFFIFSILIIFSIVLVIGVGIFYIYKIEWDQSKLGKWAKYSRHPYQKLQCPVCNEI